MPASTRSGYSFSQLGPWHQPPAFFFSFGTECQMWGPLWTSAPASEHLPVSRPIPQISNLPHNSSPPKKKSQFHHNETMGNSFKWKKKSISPRFLCRKKKLDAISSSQLPSPDPLPTFAPTFCWGTSGPSAEADPVAAFQAANGRPAQGTRDLITGIFCWNPKKWWNLWPGPKKNGNFVYVNY